MTKEEVIDIAIQAGFFVREDEAYSPSSQEDHELTPYLRTFAKLVAEKAIEPYLPYKQHIETMERAFDAHLKKAMGK